MPTKTRQGARAAVSKATTRGVSSRKRPSQTPEKCPGISGLMAARERYRPTQLRGSGTRETTWPSKVATVTEASGGASVDRNDWREPALTKTATTPPLRLRVSQTGEA